MSWLQFTSHVVDSLAKYMPWPIAVTAICFIFRRQIEFLLLRLTSAKYQGAELQFADISRQLLSGPLSETEKADRRQMQIAYDGGPYKLYSNGLIVQRWKLSVPAHTGSQFCVYPVAFPNEVISIQPVGDLDVRVERISLGNCELAFSMTPVERDIELIASGI
jgi:hypothetical protein